MRRLARRIALAVAAQIERDHPVIARQVRQHAGTGVPAPRST
jgi:hypothetical protein